MNKIIIFFPLNSVDEHNIDEDVNHEAEENPFGTNTEAGEES